MNFNFVIAALAATSFAAQARAVALDQIDTFSSGNQGWSAGAGPLGQFSTVSPAVVRSGGPGGVDDAFLRVTSDGDSGTSGRLVAMNTLGQWSGNYTAAGVSGISVDLKNFGTTDLIVRLYFEDPIPGPPRNEAVTGGVLIRAGGDWTRVLFRVKPAHLSALRGSSEAALSDTRVLRVLSNTTADFAPERAVVVLGLDNIQAVPIPATAVSLLVGLALFAACSALAGLPK